MICNPFLHYRALFTEKCKDQPALLEAFLTLEKEFDSFITKISDEIPENLKARLNNVENFCTMLENKLNAQQIEINTINTLIESLQSDISFINNEINLKANKDATNLTQTDITSWKNTLEVGKLKGHTFSTYEELFNFLSTYNICFLEFIVTTNITSNLRTVTIKANNEQTYNLRTANMITTGTYKFYPSFKKSSQVSLMSNGTRSIFSTNLIRMNVSNTTITLYDTPLAMVQYGNNEHSLRFETYSNVIFKETDILNNITVYTL